MPICPATVTALAGRQSSPVNRLWKEPVTIATKTVYSGATELHSVVARLAGCVEHDPVLADYFDPGRMWSGNARVTPSGPDRIASAVARSVVGRPETTVAIALPRGIGPTPVLLGVYLSLWRKRPALGYGRMVGSVAVSTRRAALRELARGLRFDGSELEDAIPLASLVGEPVTGQRKVRAAALSLDRRSRRGICQGDSYLLFQHRDITPPVAYNVISAMVVDTVGASVGSWEATFERNGAARRRQVWVGELGNGEFEAFCERRDIPLVRLDWALLHAAAQAWGTGTSTLASTGLAARALTLPATGALVVRHDETEYWLRELAALLNEMRSKARFGEAPEVFTLARVAGALLARTAYPLEHYEQAAGKLSYGVHTAKWLCDRVEQASASPFRGHWKPVFHTYWPGVKACLQQLTKLLADPEANPKWWALQGRLLSAVEAGDRVTVLCQTRAERMAVTEALAGENGLLDAADLEQFVDVRSFSQRGAHGDDPSATTLLLGPPPERHSGVYLAGERGRVEVLCFRHEVRRLRGRLLGAWRDFSDPKPNHAALDRLALGTRPKSTAVALPAATELLVELPGYEERTPFAEPDGDQFVQPPEPEDEFWECALELRSSELPDEPPDDDEPPGERAGAPGRAVLVSFDAAPSMYLREDAEVTVIVTGEEGAPDAVGIDAAQLTAGNIIAVLPGSERGSLLAELMGAWDEQLARVRQRYLPMYERALQAALAQHGIDGVADRVGLTAAAVYTWERGHNYPGSAAALKRLLEASGDEQAIANQAVIQHYFSKTRGAHRHIGRVLNDAVGETVLHRSGGGDNVRKLEELVGVDLTDLFDNVHVLRVSAVSEPRDVPAGVCGSFLDPEDPYLKHKGAL